MKSKLWMNIVRVLILILVIGLSVYIFIVRDKLKDLGVYGYPGIFLVSLISNANLFLPVPGLVIATTMGSVFNPILVALAAGAGAAIGELTGYMAGFSGQFVVEKSEIFRKTMVWMKKYGGVVVFVLAAIPNPLFDIAGICAGVLKMPVYEFLLYNFAGKFLKMLVAAYAGYATGHILP